MNQHLDRARLLMAQERYTQAMQEISSALSQEPEDGELHSMMAICLARVDRKKEAIAAARKAVSLDPQSAYAQYVLATVYLAADKYKEAEAAAHAALAIEPYFPNAWATLAVALSMMFQWRRALDAANQGLAIDPDNVDCHQIRAQALSFLGKTDEARDAASKAIAEDPEAADSHAHLGWVELRRGRHREAIEHFQTALRIDPNEEFAREGLLDALRIRFPLYRWVYQFQMLLARFTTQAQWAIWIGLFIGFRVIREVAKSNPTLMPYLLPLIILYGVFVWATWIGEPLVNITLLMHPLGRLALPRRERTETWVIATFLGVGLVAGLVSLSPVKLWVGAILAAVFVVLLSLSTRIRSSIPARVGLFWGLAVLGAILVSIGFAAQLMAK